MRLNNFKFIMYKYRVFKKGFYKIGGMIVPIQTNKYLLWNLGSKSKVEFHYM